MKKQLINTANAVAVANQENNMEKEISGVIVVNKPQGITSHDVVFKMRKLFMTKKVGHTGTLDPMATGVLPILVGRSAKAAEYLLSNDKAYEAKIKLGITTDTEDITGKILTKCDTLPTKTEFFAVCEKFKGELLQTPPMYSALKVNGQKLCDLARQGIEIERAPREIFIKSLIPEVIDEQNGEYSLKVECSKGTYIRTLCADIGKALGCGGVMSALNRTKSGNFDISLSYTIEQLENMSYDDRAEALIPTEKLFAELENVILPDFYAKLFKSGCEIYQYKIKTAHPVDSFVRVSDKNGFFALGKVMNFEGGTAIKSVKMFVI